MDDRDVILKFLSENKNRHFDQIELKKNLFNNKPTDYVKDLLYSIIEYDESLIRVFDESSIGILPVQYKYKIDDFLAKGGFSYEGDNQNDIFTSLDLALLKGDDLEPFSVKNLLYDNKITINLDSEESHELIESTISMGLKFGYFNRPTKEQWVEFTKKGLKARAFGGHKKYITNESDSSLSITNNFYQSNINQLNQDSNIENSTNAINPTETEKKESLLLRFWKLISENKLISGIILVLITEELTLGKVWKTICSYLEFC